MRIAVLCPSEIAHRRFMPALAQAPALEYAGVGMATPEEHCVGLAKDAPTDADVADSENQRERTHMFEREWGGKAYGSYEEVLADESVGAVYIPLPPALHAPWAERALEAGKHVLLEKPFATSEADARRLTGLAERRGLAVHENYMFAFHSQIAWLEEAIASGRLGEVRMARIDFGFPFRGRSDFRYSRALGGGALLDCGGYTLKLAAMLLGASARIVAARSNFGRDLEVDLYGSAMLANDEGAVVQLAFGMDNDYRCSIDVWGSEATLTSGRILTAPAGLEPTMTIRRNGEEKSVTLPADDSFRKSIEHFARCIEDGGVRKENMEAILRQARLVEDFRRLAS